MGGGDRGKVEDVLAKRGETLRALLEEPRAKRDLVDALDIPRSTLDRAVRELETAGLVEYRDGVYRPTLFGRTALETHEAYRRSLDDLASAADVVAPLPPDSPLDRTFLVGAEVVASAPHMPDQVVGRLIESVGDADRIRGVAPVGMDGHLDAFRDATTTRPGGLELVLTPELFDHIARTRPEETLDTIETGRATLFRTEVPFRFGLWLADDREAGVVVYTDTGIRGVLVNDAEPAVEWALDLYERVQGGAEPVRPDHVRAAHTS
jgi:predicted transcriptional regulator